MDIYGNYPDFDPMCQEWDGGDDEDDTEAECACLITWPNGIPPGHNDMACPLEVIK
jgi:hypothetical protein